MAKLIEWFLTSCCIFLRDSSKPWASEFSTAHCSKRSMGRMTDPGTWIQLKTICPPSMRRRHSWQQRRKKKEKRRPVNRDQNSIMTGNWDRSSALRLPYFFTYLLFYLLYFVDSWKAPKVSPISAPTPNSHCKAKFPGSLAEKLPIWQKLWHFYRNGQSCCFPRRHWLSFWRRSRNSVTVDWWR